MAQHNCQNSMVSDPITPMPSYPATMSSEAAEFLQCRLRPSQLQPTGDPATPWLWHGYVGCGKMMLLTSQWKSGKTTLVSILLKTMAAGGELGGLAVKAGKAAVLAEESSDVWKLRHEKLHLEDHVNLFCRPFRGKPTMTQWCGMVEAMLYLQRQEGLDLLVIDSLTEFLPGHNENSAAAIMESLRPLRELTAAGIGLLLLHHPRKGATVAGQAARGSGALPSHVDIIAEMSWHTRTDDEDRRRWLRAYSRYDDTRRRLILELNPEGTDYLVRQPGQEESGAECWDVICMVLNDARERLTRREILEEWPEDFSKPDSTTIWKLLNRGIEQGKIRKRGSSRKYDPFRYWLPEKEEDFKPDVGAPPEAWERYRARRQEKCLQDLINLGKGAERWAPKANPEAPAAPAAAATASAIPEPAAAATAVSGAADSCAEPMAPKTMPEEDSLKPDALVASSAPERECDFMEKRSVADHSDNERQPDNQPDAKGVEHGLRTESAPPAPANPLIAISPVAPIIRTPDPVLSDEEKKRRIRRWPYG
jgi:AAA domain